MHNRRNVLKTLGAFSVITLSGYRAAFATTPGAAKFVLIVLRGAMDGLSAVPPVFDTDYAALRGTLSLPISGEGAVLPFLKGFGLHPSLASMASDKLVVAHAIASPYRQRSHFDGQAILELGTSRLGGSDGWLNRALMKAGTKEPAMAVGSIVPLVLQGNKTVMNWKPGDERAESPDMYSALERMYEGDAMLLKTLSEGMRARGITLSSLEGRRTGNSFDEACRALGNIMKAENGPSVAVMELGGWDTHVGQGTSKGRLAGALGNLDAGITALRNSLGDAWASTAVCAATEFGRTARPNGTGGTDHGTAGAAFLAGGSLRESRILSDWPGLSGGALYENRDLAPTGDIRSLFKAVLSDHLKMPAAAVDAAFPDARGIRAYGGLFT